MVAFKELEGKQTHVQDKLILRHMTERNADKKYYLLIHGLPIGSSSVPLNLIHKSNTDLH